MNREENRDGNDNNRSWNVGVEGESDDPTIAATRRKLQKSMLASLILSTGVPMITMGDEVGRSQYGSNNAYSLPLDGDLTSEEAFRGGWALNWKPTSEQLDLFESVASLNSLRNTYLSDVIKEFFTGELDLGTSRKDLAWFRRNGEEMEGDSWQQVNRNYLAMYVDATANRALLMLFNGSTEEQEFTLPAEKWGTAFRTVFDSAFDMQNFEPSISQPGGVTKVAAHAAQVWLVNRN